MAGHNQWSKLKRRKGAPEPDSGKLSSKLASENTVAANLGNGAPRQRLAQIAFLAPTISKKMIWKSHSKREAKILTTDDSHYVTTTTRDWLYAGTEALNQQARSTIR